MANTLATPDWTTMETARRFTNNLRGVGQFNRSYNDEFVHDGAKVGDTVKVRLEQQYTASSGEALELQNLYDRTVNISLNRRRHVGFQYSSAQATTDLDMISERYVKPAADTLANTYDRLCLQDVYKSVFHNVGTPGTSPSAALTFLQAMAKIQDQAGPDTDLVAVLEPYSQVTMANAVSSLFNPQSAISETWRRGQFANDQLGIARWFTDQNIPRHTTGACTSASTPLVNGAGQTGSSIITDGWGSGACSLKQGDYVTFAGVYEVNPLSKENTGRLMQFAISSDISDTAGAITLPITPSIITSGALQNVDAAPANNAVVTYLAMAAGGTQTATIAAQNLVFHRDAFASVMADLVMPRGGANSSRVRDRDLGVALRYVEQYNVTSDQNLNRLDILFGAAAIQPRLATRVQG